MTASTTPPSLLGIAEIAEYLEVNRTTVDQWRWRKLLPDPTWTVSGSPVWNLEGIEAWAVKTGRLDHLRGLDDLAARPVRPKTE